MDQLVATCFIISLFTAQHVSNVSKSIFRSLRLIVDLFHVLCCSGSMCVGVTAWFGWGRVVSLCRLKHCFSLHSTQYNTWNKSTISRKLLKMVVLTFETCWAVNSDIVKQVTSSWSNFIQVCRYLFTAKPLYMFRVSEHPSSGVLKTGTTASGTGHNTGTATSLQRCLIRSRWREVAVPVCK